MLLWYSDLAELVLALVVAYNKPVGVAGSCVETVTTSGGRIMLCLSMTSMDTFPSITDSDE
jgi:hypothetical protein